MRYRCRHRGLVVNGVRLVIRLDAGHDVNGNPRRLLVADLGRESQMVIDEGYGGTGVKRIESTFGLASYNGFTLAITPRQYRDLLKLARS